MFDLTPYKPPPGNPTKKAMSQYYSLWQTLNHTEEGSDEYDVAWSELLELENTYNFSDETLLNRLRR